jgi:low affinity Fe/Cu permease
VTRTKGGLLERLARKATSWTGSSWAFAAAVGTILVWAAVGPVFHFSDTWQLVINTGTTIVTFLMVFLIQRSQNKDAQATHLKLNELIAAVGGASNRLINVEDLSEKEVTGLHRHYAKLVELAKAEGDLTRSHSIEEAEGRHHSKRGREVAPGQALPGEGNGRHGTDVAARRERAPPQARDPREGPGAAEPPTQGEQASPGMEEVIARFLNAAEKLKDRIRWHQQQIDDHKSAVAELKDMLARHGVRMKPLLPRAEHPAGTEGRAGFPDAMPPTDSSH